MVEIFFVSLGAILGSNTRFKIIYTFKKLNLSQYFFILIINTFASFCLGLFLSLIEHKSSFIYSYQLVLFFSIGFLGSLSSFSSFVNDLFELCLQLKFFNAFKLFIVSLFLGISFFVLGFMLGDL